jgi:hypothetical protein
MAGRGAADPPRKEALGAPVSGIARLAVMFCVGLLCGAAISEGRMIVAIYYMHKLGVTLTICKGWWGGL